MSSVVNTSRRGVAAVLLGIAVFGASGCANSVTVAGETVATTTSTRQTGAATTTSADAEPAGKASVEVPADLPSGLPLPKGDLVDVSSGTGERVLVYRGDAELAKSYFTALTGQGYTTIGDPTAFTATKGTSTVVVAAGGGTVTVTVAG